MTRTDRALLQFKPGDHVALIAGGGKLPVEIADALAARGQAPLVLMIEGEVSEAEKLGRYETLTLPIEDFGRLAALIRKHGITHIVLGGSVSRRPSIWRFRPTFALLKMMPRMLRALASGDNRLLSTGMSIVEGYGAKFVGAHEIVAELLAPAGPLTKLAPSADDQRDIDAAWTAAKAIGALDIGQAAVAIGGRAVELEGVEGTAGLLERIRNVRSHGRIASKKRGVLVKCTKPGQELRADLPTIGPETVDAAHAAGLAGIGVEAELSFVLESAETIARADRLGLFIVGLEPRAK